MKNPIVAAQTAVQNVRDLLGLKSHELYAGCFRRLASGVLMFDFFYVHWDTQGSERLASFSEGALREYPEHELTALLQERVREAR